MLELRNDKPIEGGLEACIPHVQGIHDEIDEHAGSDGGASYVCAALADAWVRLLVIDNAYLLAYLVGT